MESLTNTIQDMTIQNNAIIQYDYNYIMSIRNRVSKRLPLNVFNKIVSYQKFGGKKRSSKLNKFMLTRNPEAVDIEEVKEQVKKEMRGILNKVTGKNIDAMKDKINSVINLVNKINEKTEIHKILMSMLLEKAITEKSWSAVYAKILEDMSLKVDLDYRDYLDNLFVDIKKTNTDTTSYSKDYSRFCDQIADKSKFIGLFIFIGELHKMKMLETVLIKKYIMILLNNIVKAEENTLIMETNAECIKGLLLICRNRMFYELVCPKFNKMKDNKKYKMRFRFILMDITDAGRKL